MASYREQLGQAMEKSCQPHFFPRPPPARRRLDRPADYLGRQPDGLGRRQTFKARFENVCRACQEIHPHWKLGTSYGGFTEALRRESPRIIPQIKGRLQRRMQERFAEHGKRNERLSPRRIRHVLAVDGTRIETPRTLAKRGRTGMRGPGEDRAPGLPATADLAT